MRVTLLIVLILVGWINTSFAYDKAKLMEAYFSVVMIRGFNEQGGLAYGSGVVLDKTKVITNCHIFRTTQKPWISRGEDKYEITSVKADVWHDICLVTTEPLPFKPVTLGKSKDLQRGQEIIAIGYSNGVPSPMTSSGSIKGLYDENNGKVIRSNAKFTMGASGSGLFDMDGKLVGINTFKTAGRRSSIHFALPIEWLSDLEKQPVSTTFPIIGKALWEEDEDKKPFYMQAAVPETRSDWLKLAEVAEKWIKAEPQSPEAWYAFALAEENLNRAVSAKQAYQTCLSLDTANQEVVSKVEEMTKASEFATNRGE